MNMRVRATRSRTHVQLKQGVFVLHVRNISGRQLQEVCLG